MEVSGRNPLQEAGKNMILPLPLRILQPQSPRPFPRNPHHNAMISINEEYSPRAPADPGAFEREVAALFGPKGSLAAIRGFEWRPEQQRMAGDAVTKMQEELTDLKPKLLVAVDEAGKMAVIIDKEVKEVISSSASSESDLNEEEVRAREWRRPTERPLMRLIGGDRGGGRP
jgi:hypothetical protein